MTTSEVQKALDRVVDSVDPQELATVMERQTMPTIRCYICGHESKNLRGNSAHLRSHRTR